MSDVETEPPRKKEKQLFVTSFLVPQINSGSSEPTDDTITNTDTPAPAAVAIEEMIAPDIAEALHLRLQGRLTSELRRHFIESALKVPPDFQFHFLKQVAESFTLTTTTYPAAMTASTFRHL